MGAREIQIGGAHYKNYEIQPIEFIFKNKIPFIESCIIKYALRHREKNGVEDLKVMIPVGRPSSPSMNYKRKRKYPRDWLEEYE